MARGGPAPHLPEKRQSGLPTMNRVPRPQIPPLMLAKAKQASRPIDGTPLAFAACRPPRWLCRGRSVRADSSICLLN